MGQEERGREWDCGAREEAVLKWFWPGGGEGSVSDICARLEAGKLPKLPDGQEIQLGTTKYIIWELLRQGLLLLAIGRAGYDWTLGLTPIGKAIAEDSGYDHYNSHAYLRNLQVDIPTISPIVLQYAHEALECFRAHCYLATVLMVGVASEVAFFSLCESLAKWIGKTVGSTREEEFRRKLRAKRQYNEKFILFRKTVEMNKVQIGEPLCENLEIPLNSILQIFRLYRNDAGHAAGKPIAKKDADLVFHLFPVYMQTLYGLKAFLDEDNRV